MTSKRKAAATASVVEEVVDPNDELVFTCLGGGNEVGRSCHILQYKGKTVMLDAGMHPAYDGLSALPFYDDFDLSTVDVLLISHFHIDHAASLPYVLSKTNFRGRVFMTHPTKAIYKWLIQDSVRVSSNSDSTSQSSTPYTEADHLSTFPLIEAIDYHTTHTISSIRITPLPAGHVLGAAMFLITISGLTILFTGDYSIEADRHLISASVPANVKVDVLITESTYGIASHVPRLEREQALMKSITGILNRGGRVLMPVFALGRAQELLLILDEYWARHKEVQGVPIYYASNLARKCMLIYQTYIGAMNDNIKRLFRERMAESEANGGGGSGGPWDFKHIRSLKSLERFDDVGSCVMLASPGMMQNGISRELLERWAPSDKNGVIITGYSVEGTMAKSIMQEPDQIQAIMVRNTGGANNRRASKNGDDPEKVMVPRRCSVQEFSFAAHVDGTENREFIEKVAAPVVILVHGEQHNMMRLKSKLLSLNASLPASRKVKVFSPRNCEDLRIPFKAEKIAKVVGKLANMPHTSLLPRSGVDGSLDKFNVNDDGGKIITGVLVQDVFKLSLMAPEDLREYAGLTTTVVMCKQRVRLSAAGIDLIKWALESTFGSIEEIESPRDTTEGPQSKRNGDVHMNGNGALDDADEEIERLTEVTYLIMGCVTVRWSNTGEVDLEWEGNLLNDGVADAVLAVLSTVESSPAAVKHSSMNHSHSHSHSHLHDLDLPTSNPVAKMSHAERLDRLFMLLEAQFGPEALAPIETPRIAPNPTTAMTSQDTKALKSSDSESDSDDMSESDADIKELQENELERLHKLGIPVPGIEIKVDKMVARIWLEDLEVESSHFVAGLSSGILSAVLLQPADLLKTRVQQSGSSSLRASFQEIWKSPNTIRSFWRGTLPSALRTGFGSALYFTSLNALRQSVEKSNLLKSIGAVEQGALTSSSLPKLSNLANLTTGAIARASAGFVLMPMTVIKVRYESNLYAYGSIAGAGKDILKTEGFRGFFSGFGATAIRDAPYAGLYVLFYEQLKKQLSILAQNVLVPGDSDAGMKWSTSTSINFTSGVVAAGLATAITNPFDSIKTRIQLKPREYRNIVQAGRRMIRKDGIKSLFDGMALRMSRKAISSALAWTLYEELIRRAEHTWKRSRSEELLNHP